MPGSRLPGSEPTRPGRQVNDGAPHQMATCQSPPEIHPSRAWSRVRTFIHRELAGCHAPSASPLAVTVNARSLAQAILRTVPCVHLNPARSTIPAERHGCCCSQRDGHRNEGVGVWVSSWSSLLSQLCVVDGRLCLLFGALSLPCCVRA